jgi:hypothetical protein
MDSPTAARARCANSRPRPEGGDSSEDRGVKCMSLQNVRNSRLSGVNRASALCGGLELCSRARRPRGPCRRGVANCGAAYSLRKLPNPIPLTRDQHSFRRLACPRFRVSRTGPDSTIESSSHTASSCSTLGANCRSASFRVEPATWFSLPRRYKSPSGRQIVARNASVCLVNRRALV